MTFSMGAALLLAAAIGVSLGAFGAGGSIITLPVLVYVAGIPAHTAISMSLVIVGATSMFGAYLHYRHGQVYARAVMMLGSAGMAGAFLGSSLTHLVSEKVLMLAFALLMLGSGTAMLRRKPDANLLPRCSPPRCLSIGAAVGVMTGFLGVGGGFLIVPALIIFGGLAPKTAVGSSLAIIGLNSAAGLLGHLRYSEVDWRLTSAFLAVAVVGMAMGARICTQISQQALQRTFAWFIIAVAVVIGGVNLR
ncbi:MAG: sulfite exporter TauE/SafE family protein [Bryobacterales bacterium]